MFGAAPALAEHYDDDRYYPRRSSNPSYEEQQRRTREAWARNGERLKWETREAWARNAERLRYEQWRAQRREHDRDWDRYDREEQAFLRFADRNRDGHISRREYEWAADRW